MGQLWSIYDNTATHTEALHIKLFMTSLVSSLNRHSNFLNLLCFYESSFAIAVWYCFTASVYRWGEWEGAKFSAAHSYSPVRISCPQSPLVDVRLLQSFSSRWINCSERFLRADLFCAVLITGSTFSPSRLQPPPTENPPSSSIEKNCLSHWTTSIQSRHSSDDKCTIAPLLVNVVLH